MSHKILMDKSVNKPVGSLSGMLFILFLCILIGCSNNLSMPPYNHPVDSWNKEIGLEAPGEWNTFKIDSPVHALAMVVREPDATIIMAGNFDISLYQWDGSNWKSIENMATYSSSTRSLFGDYTQINIAPKLENEGQEIRMRVVISGRYITAEQEKTVGAYIDLALQP